MEKICEMQNATVKVEDDNIKIYNESDTKYFSKEGKELKNTQVYSNNKLFVKVEDKKYGFQKKNPAGLLCSNCRMHSSIGDIWNKMDETAK